MLAIDCETTGLDIRHGARPFFVTTCDEGGNQEWWNWSVNPITREPRIPKEDVERIQHLILTSGDIIGQNIKFDIAALASIGITQWPWDRIHDTLVAGHLLASNKPHNLTDMAIQYLGIRIEPLEEGLHRACEESRRYCRRALPHWQIAKQGRKGMPSAKGKCWKFDMWLPRALVTRLWESSELYKYIRGKDKCSLNSQQSVMHMQKLDGWSYLPPKFCKRPDEVHPWWTALEKYSNADSSVTVMLWQKMRSILEHRKLWNIYLERRKLIRISLLIESKGMTISGNRNAEIIEEYREDSERLGSICVDIAKSYGFDLDLPRNGNNRSLMETCFGVPLDPDDPWHGPRVGGLGLPVIKRGKKSEAPSLDKNVLEKYRVSLPRGSKQLAFVTAMIDKRKCDTALSYLEGYRRFWVPVNTKKESGRGCNIGTSSSEWYRLYPSMNPTGSDTLRWSSSNPNGQNLCTDGDTEFLTDIGWVKATELTEDRLVAQYHRDNSSISFTEFKLQVSHFKGNMCHIKTEQQIDLLLTPNHRCLLQDRKTLKKFDVEAKDFKGDHRHIHAGNYTGGESSLSQAEVIWLCAVQADGSYHTVKGDQYGISFAFKKERKIKRLRQCLIDLRARFSERTRRGITQFYIGKNEPITVMAKGLMPQKCFGQWIINCDRWTLDMLCKEVVLWDGSARSDGYTSSQKCNADWVQILWILSGSRASIATYIPSNNRLGREHHRVNVSKGRYHSMTTNFTSIQIPWDGLVYCVTVPSGYTVIRRNGKVSVTGNSKQEGFNLRYAFGPAPGREWWSMDAKNIELRIPAYEANEKDLIWVFEHPNDPPYYGSYHLVVFDTLHPTLYKKHGKKCKELYESTWYQWVKNGNFAVIYGCQRKKADQTYHVEGAYDKVRSRFPNIAKLADKQINFANKWGYVETIPDRKVDPHRGYPLLCTRTDDGRVLPTVPLNYHVSGTAMQWMNTSMISCQEIIDQWNEQGFDAFITLQVHDELTFDMPRGPHPKEDVERARESGTDGFSTEGCSNYWRALILQKAMMASGDRIGVPTPVSMKYATGPWDEGESYA